MHAFIFHYNECLFTDTFYNFFCEILDAEAANSETDITKSEGFIEMKEQ